VLIPFSPPFAGGVTQVIECLPTKHETPSSIPSTTKIIFKKFLKWEYLTFIFFLVPMFISDVIVKFGQKGSTNSTCGPSLLYRKISAFQTCCDPSAKRERRAIA
jgi:hypothetical protein